MSVLRHANRERESLGARRDDDRRVSSSASNVSSQRELSDSLLSAIR